MIMYNFWEPAAEENVWLHNTLSDFFGIQKLLILAM